MFISPKLFNLKILDLNKINKYDLNYYIYYNIFVNIIKIILINVDSLQVQNVLFFM